MDLGGKTTQRSPLSWRVVVEQLLPHIDVWIQLWCTVRSGLKTDDSLSLVRAGKAGAGGCLAPEPERHGFCSAASQTGSAQTSPQETEPPDSFSCTFQTY